MMENPGGGGASPALIPGFAWRLLFGLLVHHVEELVGDVALGIGLLVDFLHFDKILGQVVHPLIDRAHLPAFPLKHLDLLFGAEEGRSSNWAEPLGLDKMC
jgi:hypothetical protein